MKRDERCACAVPTPAERLELRRLLDAACETLPLAPDESQADRDETYLRACVAFDAKGEVSHG